MRNITIQGNRNGNPSRTFSLLESRRLDAENATAFPVTGPFIAVGFIKRRLRGVNVFLPLPPLPLRFQCQSITVVFRGISSTIYERSPDVSGANNDMRRTSGLEGIQ